MEKIICNKRNKDFGYKAKQMRRKGKVPGIIYAKGMKNLLFEIGSLELNREISKNGEHGIVNIDLDGNTHKTLIKEIQRDPLTHKVIHIDLEEVSKDEKIQTDIPLVFQGEQLIIKKGGIVQKEKDNVKVQCLSSEIPKYINVDLSKLNMGDTFRVGDLEIASEISFVEDLNKVIVSITKENRKLDLEQEEIDEEEN